MMTRGATRMTRVVMGHMGPRYFSTALLRNDLGTGVVGGATAGLLHGFPVNPSDKAAVTWVRHFSVMGSRSASTAALNDKEQDKESSEKKVENAASSGGAEKSVVSYWGVPPSKTTKPDGTEWKWNCFRVSLVN